MEKKSEINKQTTERKVTQLRRIKIQWGMVMEKANYHSNSNKESKEKDDGQIEVDNRQKQPN